MITIFQIDIQNCNNWPLLRSFEVSRTIHLHRLKSYKKRLKSKWSRLLGKDVTVLVRYKDAESKYNEKEERSKQ